MSWDIEFHKNFMKNSLGNAEFHQKRISEIEAEIESINRIERRDSSCQD